jgi:GLPGLI family protein
MKSFTAYLFLATFFFVMNVSGQKISSVDYKEWYGQSAYISVGTPIFKLVLNPHNSMYYQSDLIKNKSLIFAGKSGNKERDFTIKFYDSKKLLTLAEKMNNQVILVSDSLNLMKWKIIKSKPIRYLGLDCYQAKGHFRGRNYTAYFAPQLKISDGPFKFSGLPGLIIKIASDDNYKIWQAIKINYQENNDIQIPEKFRETPISFASYSSMKKKEDSRFIKEYKAKNPPKPGESYTIFFDYVEKTIEID